MSWLKMFGLLLKVKKKSRFLKDLLLTWTEVSHLAQKKKIILTFAWVSGKPLSKNLKNYNI